MSKAVTQLTDLQHRVLSAVRLMPGGWYSTYASLANSYNLDTREALAALVKGGFATRTNSGQFFPITK